MRWVITQNCGVPEPFISFIKIGFEHVTHIGRKVQPAREHCAKGQKYDSQYPADQIDKRYVASHLVDSFGFREVLYIQNIARKKSKAEPAENTISETSESRSAEL